MNQSTKSIILDRFDSSEYELKRLCSILIETRDPYQLTMHSGIAELLEKLAQFRRLVNKL